ncbi:MAG: serine/threonine protein kinase, partial [Gemmatimonadales bacterium]|nr:serine/threonine protein kinase [Gemmatimonadales bacterium]
GMATVYVARDMKHNRSVAVKVLRADLAATLGPDRFLKEIEIAAQLNHPHILALIDSGEAAGFLYYVMPLIQGSSLRRRLERNGRLDLAEALTITREVAEALSYAHRKGVVHRDIKPENILFSEGHAIVADFGIARAVGSAGIQHLTRTGVPLGTPGYMSPEQAIGRTDIGPAADVYGLACVTYEMVIGEPPDMWPSDEALRLARFIDAQPTHRDRLEALPSEVERALVRALALRPNQRFSNPVEFADALERPMGVRRYSRTEVDRIVGHAADLQATRPTQSDALTLGTVQQIAADVGIPPEHVRSAARALEPRPQRPPAQPSKFLGGPTTLDVEYTLEGEVAESEYLTLVEDIRTTLGVVGNVSTLGTSMTWNSAGMGNTSRDVTVAITSRGGGTRLRVTERLKNLAGGLFGGIMGGVGGGGMGLAMGIGMGVFDSPAAAVLLVLTNVGFSYVLARTIFRSTSRKRSGELQRLADRLAAYITDVNQPALPQGVSARPNDDPRGALGDS